MQRFQLVENTTNHTLELGVSKYCILEVEVDDNNPNIVKYACDILPIELTASSISEMKELLQIIYQDILKYPTITTTELDNLGMEYMSTIDIEELEVDDSDVEELMCVGEHTIDTGDYNLHCDTGDNIVDIVDYFNRKR